MSKGVHIHVHCEESLLDGLSTIKQLVAKAKSLGMPALGLTDHGVCGGIPDLIKECEKQGIKPIPGCEVYTTKNRLIQSKELEEKRVEICKKYKITDNKGKPKMKAFNDFLRKVRKSYNSLDEEASVLLKDYLMEAPKEAQGNLFSGLEVNFNDNPDEKINNFKKDVFDYLDHGNFHMVLIAINNEGLADLYEIVSDAHINGFYSDPRTDLEFIRSKGLGKNIIATSACLGSFFSQLCLADRIEDAQRHIAECKETFHTFYLEKQATSIPEQIFINNIIDQLSIETNTPKILTTDVHYANKEDHHIHDILVASSTKKCISDENRMKYAHEFWMKSDQEMLEKCNDPEAWVNTMKIADIVNITLPEKPLFPKFIAQEGDTSEKILRKKAWAGLYEMALTDKIDIPKYSKRLQYELDVICSEGFQDYFLIEEDMINATVKAGFLVGPGRGSGAGSLVCRVLKITYLDPIKENLLFERFLNPERAGYPDIDTDFGYEGAQWVQQYLKRKYGEDKVAQIGTKGRLAARAVCRRVGKTLGFDLATQDAFAKSIPDTPGITLEKAYQESPMVKQYADAYSDWWKAMIALEGHIYQVSTHAGGIVISPDSLTKVTPLRMDSANLETTQFDMEWIEKFLVKFDVLKIDTLDLIKMTMEYAGIWGEINIYRDIDINDPRIYEEVYQALNLSGIFQCESDLFKKIINDMKPTSFEDISVIVALGRPGPLDLIPSYVKRKWGKEKISYLFPELEPVLKETFGIFVYQEQIMKSSQIIGGFTLGQADILRKAIGKKKMDLIEEWIGYMIYGNEELGIEGAVSKGFDKKKLLKLKDDWLKFGDYAFNKAHSAAYAFLSCITAYLKAYYPVEFMAALMTISEGKRDKNRQSKNLSYMKECEEMGIRILPPDINVSGSGWTPRSYEQPIQNEEGDLIIGEIRYGLSSIESVSGASVQEIIDNRPYQSLEDLTSKVNGSKVNKTKIVNLIKSGALNSINENRNQLLRNYIKARGEEYESIPNQTGKKTIIAYEIDTLGTSVSIKSRWEKVKDGSTTQITGFVRAIEDWIAKSSGKKHYTVTVETLEEPVKATVWGYLYDKSNSILRIGNKVTIKGEKNRDKLMAKSFTLQEDIQVVI